MRKFYASFDAGPNGPDWDTECPTFEEAVAAAKQALLTGRAKYTGASEEEVRENTSTEVRAVDFILGANGVQEVSA